MMTSFDLELRRNRAFGFGRKPNTTLFQYFLANVQGKQEDDDDDDDYGDESSMIHDDFIRT